MFAAMDFTTYSGVLSYIYEYEFKGEGVRLLRVYSNCSKVIVPERLDKKSVTIIGEYCFAPDRRNHKVSGSLASAIPNEKDVHFKEACGDDVTEAVLPDSVHTLERYAFMNCRHLQRVAVGKNLREIHSDVFMNCNSLEVLIMRADVLEKTGLRYMLNQLNRSISVRFCRLSDKSADDGLSVHTKDMSGDGAYEYQGMFYFPEYTESYEEIGPAHIFAMNVEGEGYRARQMFKDGILDVAGYDGIFKNASALEDVATLFYMSSGRLRYPILLADGLRKEYEKYLRIHGSEIIELVMHRRDEESLVFLIDSGLLCREAYTQGLRCAVEDGWTGGSAKLLAAGQSHTKKSRYEL